MKRRGTAQITSYFKRVKADGTDLKIRPAKTTDAIIQSASEPKAFSGAAVELSANISLVRSSSGPSPVWSKDRWVESLSADERELLSIEVETLHESWLLALHQELRKPYFLGLKRFLRQERQAHKIIFPPESDIYAWSRLTKLQDVRVVILGQDPYHNINQAHGLAFSVKEPTQAPPSLKNIFKELESCYPQSFRRPSNSGGLLVPWAEQGVLLLNSCLTVEAHKANSHSKRGWEEFTDRVLRAVVDNCAGGVCFLVWGAPAARRLDKLSPGPEHLVLKTVHPSPLSASRGWFGSGHFVKANKWLSERYSQEIDWNLGAQ